MHRAAATPSSSAMTGSSSGPTRASRCISGSRTPSRATAPATTSTTSGVWPSPDPAGVCDHGLGSLKVVAGGSWRAYDAAHRPRMNPKLIVPQLPGLRRYARALTRDAWAADDLVQDTLERACAKWQLWTAGSDLRA